MKLLVRLFWSDRTLGQDEKWHDGVLVTEAKDDRLITTELRGEPPRPRGTQTAVRTGQCHELPGMRRSSEP